MFGDTTPYKMSYCIDGTIINNEMWVSNKSGTAQFSQLLLLNRVLALKVGNH